MDDTFNEFDEFDEFDELFVFEDTIPNIVSYSVILGKEVRNELRLIRSELPEVIYNFFINEADDTLNIFIQMFAGALLSGSASILERIKEFLEDLAVVETAKVDKRLLNNIVFNDIVEGFDADPDSDGDTAPDAAG